ncbi:hypothetical protein LXA43DRAFT_1100916 [Ganoderma leucocontextum]|nr:hypothetical protein LXA43DRAFT_1100916 [Ganoderma leucocontextum]
MSLLPSSIDIQANPLELLPKLPALDNTFGAALIGTFYSVSTLDPAQTVWNDAVSVISILHPVLWLRWTVFTTVYGFSVASPYSWMIIHPIITAYSRRCTWLCAAMSASLRKLVHQVGIDLVRSYHNHFSERVYLAEYEVGLRYRTLVFVAMSLLVGELAFFAAATIETLLIPPFKGFEHLEWLISIGSAQAITADTLLTSVLIITLHRRRTGIKRTDSMIDVLILYAVSTGFLTTVFNILAFIFVLAFPGNLIYVAFSVIATKLYANTLLVALNTRHALSRGGLVEDSDIKLYGSNTVFAGSTIISTESTQRVALPEVPGSAEMMESNYSVLEIKAVGGDCGHVHQSDSESS